MPHWQPTNSPVPKFGNVKNGNWVLLNNEGKELARVFEAEQPNEHGATFIWAVWPYHRLGKVGSAMNVIDARMKAERVINQI